MTVDSPDALDDVDWQILAVLQRDARASYADLAREVAMSPSAVTERVRRLEESGVIAGYRAVVSPERVGLGIAALIRLRYPTGNYRPFRRLLGDVPEILEAHHVTGEDCFVLRVVARSMRHLEEVTGRVAALGAITTSVVYSTPLSGRPLVPELVRERPAGLAPGRPAGTADADPTRALTGASRPTGRARRRQSVAN
jgi:Lrp/AsnC family leucine-responsive transcriptional regulator